MSRSHCNAGLLCSLYASALRNTYRRILSVHNKTHSLIEPLLRFSQWHSVLSSTTTNNQIMTNGVQHYILCTNGKQLRTIKCCSQSQHRTYTISFRLFLSLFLSLMEITKASNLEVYRCVILCWLSGWLLTIQLENK